MRFSWLIGGAAAMAALAMGQSPLSELLPEDRPVQEAESYDFQSDVTRLMQVVVTRLYHDTDVFMRELLSNSNDALEKVRVASLTNSKVLDDAPELNITVIPDYKGKRIVIRDTGIGMTHDQLRDNLGTIARSGTSEFLEKLEKDQANLVGQFGLGFYSSFLVSKKVTVASKSPESDTQYLFESDADSGKFYIEKDPRGNTLGRGTEITLWLKEDSAEQYLHETRVQALILRHTQYTTSAPIYLWMKIKDHEAEAKKMEYDQAKQQAEEEGTEPPEPPVIQSKEHDGWVRQNNDEALWARDPSKVSDQEYVEFYEHLFGKAGRPIAWSHWKGDAGSTLFRALVYIPEHVPRDFYGKTYQSLDSVRLFVRRVFVTSDAGNSFLPRWLNWIRVFVDADNLPLNVGRDTLQKTRAMNRIQASVLRHAIDTFADYAENNEEGYQTLYHKASTSLKIGALEDEKHRDRLVKLLRFNTSFKNFTSLDEYVSRRREGQQQIYFLASAGAFYEDMLTSPLIEALVDRGYEVLFLTDSVDESLIQGIGMYEGMIFHDVGKDGLEFGDEEDPAVKSEWNDLAEQYKPLTSYLAKTFKENIGKVVVSKRLISSPSIVISDLFAWTGNMERLMIAQQQAGQDYDAKMAEFIKSHKKILEINPFHPLIESLLQLVEESPYDFDDDSEEARSSPLATSVQVLWDTTMVRSGYSVGDIHAFFKAIELVLRRSLRIPEDKTVSRIYRRPAPPRATVSPQEEREKKPQKPLENFEPKEFPPIEYGELENQKRARRELNDYNEPILEAFEVHEEL